MSTGSSLREQIAARRAAVRSTPTKPAAAVGQASSRTPISSGYGSSPAGQRGRTAPVAAELIEERTSTGQIKKAAKNGKLDISSLNLKRIPAEVYTELLGIPAKELSNPPSADPETVSNGLKGMTSSFSAQLALSEKAERDAVFNKAKKEEQWVEPEAELISFIAEGNEIEIVEREIGAFGGLWTVNLSNNRISSLPESFADLLRITSLNLSHNSFTDLPSAILLLPKLEVLDLSHNALTTLDLSSPIGPSDDGLNYGAGFLSTAFSRQQKKSKEIWPVLRTLNLGHNRLNAEGLRGLKVSGGLKAMRVIHLESNAFEGELDVEEAGIGKESMPQLVSLVLNENGYLRGIQGDLAQGCKVEMEGSGTMSGSRPTPQLTGEASSKAPSKPLSAELANIPNPDLRLVYRTLPAATFDSLPLEVDLDIYLPPPPSTSSGHPLVIWFHGGGLLQGNKENLPPHFRRLPQTPFNTPSGSESVAVISPNYRLAPQVPIIDILSDVTALVDFVQTKLNDRLAKAGKGEKRIDTSRICLSGGSAGGYLAMMAGMEMPQGLSDEDVGGYRGVKGIKCIAPFYPITDLADKFWSIETNPVPWRDRSIPHADAKPHIDTRAAPICTSTSDGPRSVLYSYMLQHGLFPSLLFLNQRSVGSGLDGFRPSPEALSIPDRLELLKRPPVRGGGRRAFAPVAEVQYPSIYFVYGGKDNKVQPMDRTMKAFEGYKGLIQYEYRPELGHQFDEDPAEECGEFRRWLGEHLL